MLSSEAGTPSCCAAAATSIWRMVAPATRRRECVSRTDPLPPVPWLPSCGSYAGASGRTFDQSASSSSATNSASAVRTPWPISDFGIVTCTVSSGAMRMKMFGDAEFGSPGTDSALALPRQATCTSRPPPNAAPTHRNWRLDSVDSLMRSPPGGSPPHASRPRECARTSHSGRDSPAWLRQCRRRSDSRSC